MVSWAQQIFLVKHNKLQPSPRPALSQSWVIITMTGSGSRARVHTAEQIWRSLQPPAHSHLCLHTFIPLKGNFRRKTVVKSALPWLDKTVLNVIAGPELESELRRVTAVRSHPIIALFMLMFWFVLNTEKLETKDKKADQGPGAEHN